MPVARRHHFIPQAYLAAFSDTGRTKDGQVFVVDKLSGNRFKATPKNLAVVGDFNTVKPAQADLPLDWLERELAKFDDEAITAIREVCEKLDLVGNGNNFNAIMNLVTALAIRNPRVRGSFSKFRVEVANIIADMVVSSEERWNSVITEMQRKGVELPTTDYERVRDFVRGREYDVRFSNESTVGMEFTTFPKLLRVIAARNWRLFLAPTRGPFFIAGDHPVTLDYLDGSTGPVGFGLINTEVFFPVSPRVGLHGEFNDRQVGEHVHCDDLEVGRLNGLQVKWAQRHVFSSQDHFFVARGADLQRVSCRAVRR